MRFQLFSDLHKGVLPVKKIRIVDGVDAVVVAGDICEGTENSFAYLRSFVPLWIPIVFVMGNHEFYGRFLPQELAYARSIAPRFNILFVERNVVEVAGVRFTGGTTWTDYRVFGDAKVAAAIAAARRGMNDHRRIGWQKSPWRRFRPEEAKMLHEQTRAFLETALVSDQPTVVVSHHAPSLLSVAKEFEDDLLTAAFASNIAHDLIEGGESVVASAAARRVDVWAHGHTHNSVDYRIGPKGVRVVSNAHGYGAENPNFDPELVLEVP